MRIADLLAPALAIALVAASADALAFCRTSTCPATGKTAAVCTPAEPSDCGTAVFWKSPCICFSIQKDASKQVLLETITWITETAFVNWMQADCGEWAH